jgi:hypothetical protein
MMFMNNGADAGERQPLVKSVAPAVMGKACFLTVVGALVCGWCVLDSWNRDVGANLFGVSEVSNEKINLMTGQITADVSHPFNFPLTLAFFQFAFMGLLFLVFWWMSSRQPTADIAKVRERVISSEWGGLVGTHVFSTFWLQSLMMPTQLMTPAVFAASRALEVPAAAALRHGIMGARFGGHPALTTFSMFFASMLLMYSQTQIAECLCMWSGHGVQLAGVALVLVYLLVLILPAANAVCLESVMVDLDTNPILMLATMNILACLCFAPVLALAHFAGWENVNLAFEVTMASRQLYMLVLWLCAQMTVFSAVSLALIGMMDSFWAVALRSFKAVFWWCGQLAHMYFLNPSMVLSVAKPHSSFWGFIMLGGCTLIGVAALIDASKPRENTMEAKHMQGSLHGVSASKV